MITRMKKSLNGTDLKLIAMITMLIDHIGAGIIETGLLRVNDEVAFLSIMESDWGMMLFNIDRILRSIGRISAPLFFFLLVEGFLYTKHMKKYVRTMILFAFLSEIPYDIVMYEQLVEPYAQNIFFTLSIGLLALIGIRKYNKQYIIQGIIAFSAMGVAYVLHSDYAVLGILLILCLYFFHDQPLLRDASILLFACLQMNGIWMALVVIVPIVLLHFYNGKRGKVINKYLFYCFYPVHLLMIAGIIYFI